MSTLKVNTIQSNTTSELDINSPLGTIPSLDVIGSATIGGNLNAVGVITTTSIVATTGTFSGNVSIGGTLTYEDVTNIDSVGIITARSGVRVNSGGLVVTSGVSTFTNLVVSAGSTSAPSISPTGDSNTGIFFPSPDTIAFAEGGVEALRIDSNANIGIGTTGTGDKLTVLGRLQIQNDASASSRIILRAKPGNSYRWNFDNDGGTNDLRVFREDDSTTANGVVYMRIDTSGRVTMPYQPAFSAYGTSTQTITTTSITRVEIWGGENFDNANNFTSNRFTAPVSGKYLFGINLRVDSVSSTYWRVYISRNGSTDLSTNGHAITRYEVNGAGSYHTVAATAFFSLAANDYVEVFTLSDTDSNYNAHQESQFWGHLVG